MIKMRKLTASISGIAFIVSSMAVMAKPVISSPMLKQCYASFVDYRATQQGATGNGSQVPTERSKPDNALGEPNSPKGVTNFFSLGTQGVLVVGFKHPIIGSLRVHETTWKRNCKTYHEHAQVFVSQTGPGRYKCELRVKILALNKNHRLEDTDATVPGLAYFNSLIFNEFFNP